MWYSQLSLKFSLRHWRKNKKVLVCTRNTRWPRSISFLLCSSILAFMTALWLCRSATSADIIWTVRQPVSTQNNVCVLRNVGGRRWVKDQMGLILSIVKKILRILERWGFSRSICTTEEQKQIPEHIKEGLSVKETILSTKNLQHHRVILGRYRQYRVAI